MRPSLLLSWSYHRTSLAVHSTILKGGKSFIRWRWRVEWHKNCAEKYIKSENVRLKASRKVSTASLHHHHLVVVVHCCTTAASHNFWLRAVLFLLYIFFFSTLDFVSAKFQKILRPRQKRELQEIHAYFWYLSIAVREIEKITTWKKGKKSWNGGFEFFLNL